MAVRQTELVTERLWVREVDDDEGRRLVRIVRRGSGSVVTCGGAQMVLLSAQGMDAATIAKVAFSSEDRVRDVIRNFNAGGFRRPRNRSRQSMTFHFQLEPGRAGGLPGGRRVVDDISHEGLRTLLREEGVTFNG